MVEHCSPHVSGESHRPLTAIHLKSIATHLPFVSRYAWKVCPLAGGNLEVMCTHPVCITRHDAFCRSVRARGRWTPPPPKKNIPQRGIENKRGRGKRRNRCTIATQYIKYVQLLRNYWAIVAPHNPEEQGEVLDNQLSMGTIASPFVDYCVSSRDPFYSNPNTILIQLMADEFNVPWS